MTRELRTTEMGIAWLIPTAAVVPLVWSIVTHLRLGTMPLLLDSRFWPLYLWFIAPVLGYSVIGLIGYYAAKLNSKLLTGIYCVGLVPVLLLHGFLILASSIWGGPGVVYLHAPSPLIALVLVPISLVRRFMADRSDAQDYSSDLV